MNISSCLPPEKFPTEIEPNQHYFLAFTDTFLKKEEPKRREYYHLGPREKALEERERAAFYKDGGLVARHCEFYLEAKNSNDIRAEIAALLCGSASGFFGGTTGLFESGTTPIPYPLVLRVVDEDTSNFDVTFPDGACNDWEKRERENARVALGRYVLQYEVPELHPGKIEVDLDTALDNARTWIHENLPSVTSQQYMVRAKILDVSDFLLNDIVKLPALKSAY